ncbi:MAG: hypothetical protein DRJ07_15045 [Bacteroidetes bacterium]|nr:MAG: hypothetical protein DRJ07_15045 [Bacteroidota bacterium]
MNKNKQLIRNSTAEFLIFTLQECANSIEARYEDETIWLTQKLMGELFEVDVRTVNEHLKNIYKQNELIVDATIRKFRIVQTEGKREVILKIDVSTAKNYLIKDELESLGRIVNAYLDLAEERAKRKIPMTMQDWAKRLDLFLEYDDRAVLQDSGKISAQIAKEKAETEFEKYRIVQDQLFESDFDKEIKKLIDFKSK